jgi:hypothetical protein
MHYRTPEAHVMTILSVPKQDMLISNAEHRYFWSITSLSNAAYATDMVNILLFFTWHHDWGKVQLIP